MKALIFALSTSAALLMAGCASTPSNAPDGQGQRSSETTLQPLAAQPTYASPEDAVAALYHASTAKDLAAMARIVGLPASELMSGDSEKDATQAERLAKAYDERSKIVRDGDSKARLFIGDNNYPLASSLARTGNRWSFDSAGGKEELRSRVIGENELATIGVCRAYVQAQYEYYSEDRNSDDVLQYAQRLTSTPGQHDGLYWHSKAEEQESPLGALIAQARVDGYLSGSARKLDTPKPYHGYVFRILTGQGKSAPGGRYSYIINGRMVAGFALIASPAKWGHSGIMTFIVGANGKVYEKNLGEAASVAAESTTEYNPDATWTLVQE